MNTPSRQFDIDEEYSPLDYRTHYNADQPSRPVAEEVDVRRKNIKERMQMHRMLQEYMSKPRNSVPLNRDIITPNEPDYMLEELAEPVVEYDPFVRPIERAEKRKIHADIEIDDYPSIFREHQHAKYVLETDHPDKTPGPSKISHRRISNTDPERFGVYTEGGMVFPPNTVVTANQQKKSKPRMHGTEAGRT